MSSRKISSSKLIEVNLPRPPSTNSLFTNAPGKRRVKTSTYRTFLKNAKLCTLVALKGKGKRYYQSRVKTGTTLRFELDILGNWHNKNGTIKEVDVDNFIKAAMDAVFSTLCINDKHVFEVTARKIQSKVNGAVARISVL